MDRNTHILSLSPLSLFPVDGPPYPGGCWEKGEVCNTCHKARGEDGCDVLSELQPGCLPLEAAAQPPASSAKTQRGSTEGLPAQSCPLCQFSPWKAGDLGSMLKHVALPPSCPISSGLMHKIISQDTAGKKKIFRMSSVSAREGHGTRVLGGQGTTVQGFKS